MTKLRKPRMTCPRCGSVYVLERQGEGEAPEGAEAASPPASPFYVMHPRTWDWFAFFFRLRARSAERPFNAAAYGRPAQIVHKSALQMMKDARANTPVQCDAGERPSEAERAALIKIPVDSPAFLAWRRVLLDEGYRGFGDDGSVYVWVPARPTVNRDDARAAWPVGCEPEPASEDGQ